MELKKLYKLSNKYGRESIIYFDESELKANTGRLDGWAVRGKKSMLMSKESGRKEPICSWRNARRYSHFYYPNTAPILTPLNSLSEP